MQEGDRYSYMVLLFFFALEILGVLAPLAYLASKFDIVAAVKLAVSQEGLLVSSTYPGWVDVHHVGGVRYIFVYGPSFGGVVGSLLLAAVTAATVAAASMILYLVAIDTFSRKFWLYTLPLSLLSFPFVDALVLRRVISPEYGVPSILKQYGFTVVLRGFASLYLYEFLAWFPVASALIGGYILSIPREEIEAAVQFGARGFRLSLLVARLAWPAYVTSAILVFVFTLDDVGGPYVFQDDPFARSLLAYRAYSYFLESTYGAVSLLGIGYSTLLLTLSLLVFAAGYRFLSRVMVAATRQRTATVAGPVLRASLPERLTLVAFLAAPLALRLGVIAYSFSSRWVATLYKPGFGSWAKLFETPDLLRGIVNSGLYAVVALVLMLIVGVYTGWYSARGFKLSRLVDVLAVLPLGVPGIVIAYAYFAAYSGIAVLSPYASPAPLLVLGYTVRRLPFLYSAAKAAAASIPRSLEEAGYMLGANRMRVFVAVVLPLLTPILAGPILYSSFSVAGEVSLSITIGGLAGSQGFHHPAPLMYLVAGYIGLSGAAYGGVAAAAILLAYTLTGTLAYILVRTLNILLTGRHYEG